MLETQDVLAIHELLALYGYVLDGAAWERMSEIFSEDIVFDTTDINGELVRGRDALRESWASSAHVSSHHVTNIVIQESGPNEAKVLAKGLGLAGPADVRSITYHDVVVRTDEGWRLAHRVATRTRAPE